MNMKSHGLRQKLEVLSDETVPVLPDILGEHVGGYQTVGVTGRQTTNKYPIGTLGGQVQVKSPPNVLHGAKQESMQYFNRGVSSWIKT